MKQFIKSMMLGGALVAASASQAAVVINVFDDAGTAEGLFISSLYSYTTEDFEALAVVNGPQSTPGNQQLSWVDTAATFNTNVGSFHLVTAGDVSEPGVEEGELKIENTVTGEHGREVAGGNWLDSNDAREVRWDITIGGAPFNALGFYLFDANDQGARLTLTLSNGLTESYDFNSAMANSNEKYVTIVSDVSVVSASMTFSNENHGGDGWGIDDVTVGTVPEPGTLLLMGLGLLGLGAARRRNAA